MKPWREIAIPHRDVLEGTFQQSEFAADLTAVRSGTAPREYQDAAAFFERTFITEGMRLLLTQVARRLSGQAGEPVVQLQTAFGGGKTHTLLAVYHLATRTRPLSELAGVQAVIDQSGLTGVPQARVAVLDGNAHSPGQPWRHGQQVVHTLWGELAWQLGGGEAFTLVQDADASGTSPGKDVLRDLFERHAPCVVLVDELVAYVRQFPDGQALSGGTYDSNLSFVQAMTEAAKLVPGAVVLASLPESEVEAGGERGRSALRALEKVFGRIQVLWRPVATEEAFEIVRRRLFEPVRDTIGRDAVCQAFAEAYLTEGARLPSETQQVRYRERLTRAYPIHPEVFDRLYEDWATIDGFQRTRGVLKLMAQVIYRLWKDNNKDLVILPGSLPLYDSGCRNELTYYLPAGWDPVIDGDIDGDQAETTELETREPRFGQVQAARRSARTLFLGSAPASIGAKPGTRGLDRARVLLGCLQPGQASAVYSDALNRLADRLHYLNASGEKDKDTTRFWFDTRANLRREMEDRKRRFDEKTVRERIGQAMKRILAGAALFDGTHVFTPHADVPDDSALRLVVLSPEQWYARDEDRLAVEAAVEYTRSNGSKPRQRANRLLFLVADHAGLTRLQDSARMALAWNSIVDDVREGRLNIDLLQKKQAEKELQSAEDVVPRAARECYRWLLCPTQEVPTVATVKVESFPLPTGGHSVGTEIDRLCTENELVIGTWSPVHLRERLRALYWKYDRPSVLAMTFWEDSLRYLYLPRLKTREVLAQAIRTGAASREFFGTALGQVDHSYEGFRLGDGNVQLDDTLLLIEPSAAAQFEASQVKPGTIVSEPGDQPHGGYASGAAGGSPGIGGVLGMGPKTVGRTTSKAFFGAADIHAATAKTRLIELADEIIALLAKDPTAEIKLTVEMRAEFPEGAPEEVRRAVSENAKALKLKTAEWE